MSKPYAMVLLCVAAIALGQLIFKHVASRLGSGHLSELLTRGDLLAVFAAGLALYGASTILWVLALRELPLSRAYLFVALAFVLVPLGARFMFGETLTPAYFLGVSLIVVGIIVSVS